MSDDSDKADPDRDADDRAARFTQPMEGVHFLEDLDQEEADKEDPAAEDDDLALDTAAPKPPR